MHNRASVDSLPDMHVQSYVGFVMCLLWVGPYCKILCTPGMLRLHMRSTLYGDAELHVVLDHFLNGIGLKPQGASLYQHCFAPAC